MQFEVQDAVAILTRTPTTLDTMLRGLPDNWLHASEGPNTFSPLDVLGHLIHAEQVNWIPRCRIILDHGESQAFEAFDRQGGATLIGDHTTAELLDRFSELRAASLRTLATLPLDLRATGVHPDLGRVTMENLLASWVAHDLGHISQVLRVMSRQYRETVGPWRRNFSLLA